MKYRKYFALVAAAVLLAACQSGRQPESLGDGSDPKLQNDVETLEAALRCSEFSNPERPAILLVHGTFTAGWEQYEWSYIPVLRDLGYDVCVTTYPDRGFGDQQNSAEYVVHAVRRMHEISGNKIAIIGHSQGVSVPRWAIKWWPSVQQAVDDFVMIAGPNHGTQVADPMGTASNLLGGALPTDSGMNSMPEAFYQFSPDSDFIAASNIEDETPGEIDYTSIYTLSDELVQPVLPVPTAAVDWGLENPKVSNILMQDVCPGYVTEHALIGTADGVAFALALDAIDHPGPADVERAGGAGLCTLPLLPDTSLSPAGSFSGGLATLMMEFENGPPSDFHMTNEEPPLRDYAQQRLDQARAE